jgi:inner membrane protein
MKGTNHVKFGLSAWTIASVGISQAGGPALPELLVASGLVAVGALAPDIDEPGSKISRQLGPLRHVIPPLVSWIGGGHRGMTHSPWAVVVVTVLLAHFALPPWLAIAFGFGWLSHLAGDALTPHGIPAPWPLGDRRLTLNLWRSGAKAETVAVWMLAASAAALLASAV